MKRIFFLTLSLAVAFASTSMAYPRAVEQFKSGATDVVKSPLIVKDHVMAETKDTKAHIYPLALTGGLLKGTFYMGKRVVDGTWAMATSPLEIIKK